MPSRSNKSAPSYSPAYPRVARAMARIGAERSQIAEAFGVTEELLRDWMNEYPGLAAAVEEGEADATAAVEKALWKRATGYTVMEDKAIICKGEVVIVKLMKHYPPDVAAIKFWAVNRAPDKWKERNHGEHNAAPEELADVMKRIRANDGTKGPEPQPQPLIRIQEPETRN